MKQIVSDDKRPDTKTSKYSISVLLNLRHTLRIYRMAAVVVLARLNLVRQSFYARYEGKHPLLVKQLSKINIKIKFCSVDPHELY